MIGHCCASYRLCYTLPVLAMAHEAGEADVCISTRGPVESFLESKLDSRVWLGYSGNSKSGSAPHLRLAQDLLHVLLSLRHST